VKPFNEDVDNGDHIAREAASILMASPEDMLDCFTTIVVNAKDYPGRFDSARAKEFQGLLDRNTFRVVKRSEAEGYRIYGMRYVDAIKNIGEESEFEKSRLVVQAYSDDAARHILTSAPTCQRVSQRLILALAALHPDMSIYARDISQACTQANTRLVRRVFVKAPPEAMVAEDEVLEVLLPLYGLPESGLHWFSTYQSHHIKKLQMSETEYDPCLLYQSSKNTGLEGAVVLQVDDSLGVGTAGFLKNEQFESTSFIGKPRIVLDKNPIHINGFTI
jgi:Reverse transcriptase (RNA-dependent DNA polymerase)